MVEALPQGDAYVYKYTAAKRTLNVNRYLRQLQPTNNQNFTTGNNDTIRFRFPNTEPIDLRRAYLLADITITVVGGTYKRIAFGSWSPIQRLRIHAAGETIEELEYYNVEFSEIFTKLTNPLYNSATGVEMLGIGNAAQRAADGAVTTRYVIPLYLGYFTTGVLPMHCVKNNFQELEIYLDNAATFVETDGASPSVTFSNMDLHYDCVSSWDGSYERSLQQMFDKGEFQVFFSTTNSFQNNLVNQISDLVITNRQESVRRIDTWMRSVANLTNTLIDDKFITFPKNNAFSYQAKLGSRLYPEEEIEAVGRAFPAYLYYLNDQLQWKVGGLPQADCRWPDVYRDAVNINNVSYNGNSFLMILNFESSPGADQVNNFSTEGCNDIIFKLKLSAVPPAQSQTFHRVDFNRIVQFLPSGRPLISD
jgi:hypothetical protein